MADIYGSHFEYGGLSSRMYDLVFVSLDTERWTKLAGTSESVTMYNRGANRAYIIGDDHTSSPVAIDAEITTESCRCLNVYEQRKIEKWLFGYKNYRRLYFDMADDPDSEMYEIIDGKIYRHYLNCRMINPERIEGNGGVCGYRFQILCDSNMFWQDTHVYNFTIDSAAGMTTLITVPVDTDFLEYIYPKVRITAGSDGGDITIVNNTDDSTRLTKFVSIPPHTTITMRGETNYISGNYYEKLAARNFIRLLDGENKFTILGDVRSIEFEYSPRRTL